MTNFQSAKNIRYFPHKISSAVFAFAIILAGLFFQTGCSHLSSIYAPNDYSLTDLKIDIDEARTEVINGYKGYAGKVIKVSPLNGTNWADYSRTIYWDWEFEDTGYQLITVTMSVLVESPNSGKAQTSAYKPGRLAAPAASAIKWNGPANIGWTVQIGDEYSAQFGGKPAQIPEGKWVDLTFSQSVDITNSTGGQVYLDGHSDEQGLLDMNLYVRNFKVTMRPVASFIAMTFNECPSDFTEILIDKLDEQQIKGTFFVLGAALDAMHPLFDRTLTAADRTVAASERKDMVKWMFDDGHEIGIYTNFNASAAGQTLTENDVRKELEDTRIAVQKAIYGDRDYTNYPWVAETFRDPNDSDPATLDILKKVSISTGLVLVGGTPSPSDPQASADDITAKFINDIVPWEISVNKDPRSDPAIVRVLDTLIPRLKSEGYIFTSVSEMAEKSRIPLVTGNLYTNLNPDLR
ncbi:MAG: polysaccharide deacetylase family protein [Treponema sp.]|nr:polysaccharide deacetylase family protein [Treponema sp.]